MKKNDSIVDVVSWRHPSPVSGQAVSLRSHSTPTPDAREMLSSWHLWSSGYDVSLTC